MNRLVTVVLTTVLLCLPFGHTPATVADPTPPKADLYVVYVQMVDPGARMAEGGRMLVALSNGAFDSITPCRVEDGRHCYWNSAVQGDKHGRWDTVTVRGHRFRIQF